MTAKTQEAEPNVSLNPTLDEEVIDLARAMSIAALKRLEQIVLHGAESAAVIAAEIILDRAFGSPHQRVVHVRSGVVILPEEEIDELSKGLR